MSPPPDRIPKSGRVRTRSPNSTTLSKSSGPGEASLVASFLKPEGYQPIRRDQPSSRERVAGPLGHMIAARGTIGVSDIRTKVSKGLPLVGSRGKAHGLVPTPGLKSARITLQQCRVRTFRYLQVHRQRLRSLQRRGRHEPRVAAATPLPNRAGHIPLPHTRRSVTQ